ncbi:MAG: hypothetical protein UZ08_BCD001000409 [Candidatus Parvibacillus calidus]|mgnify:CR=1 FL=1|jgi:hypothetical protein|nr:MAG: hypothetical protein UZ08_BCD001000409 [Candidatus Parvibacillus calidus]
MKQNHGKKVDNEFRDIFLNRTLYAILSKMLQTFAIKSI